MLFKIRKYYSKYFVSPQRASVDASLVYIGHHKESILENVSNNSGLTVIRATFPCSVLKILDENMSGKENGNSERWVSTFFFSLLL